MKIINSILIYIPYDASDTSRYNNSGENRWVEGLIGFFIPVVIVLFFIIKFYKKHNKKQIEDGNFIQDLPFNNDNVFAAYLCLSVILLKRDYDEAGKKVLYLKKFIHKNFPSYFDEVNFKLKELYQLKKINHTSVASWIKKNDFSIKSKYEILHFAVGFSSVDGEINDAEYEVIKDFAILLNIDLSYFDSIINQYRFEKKKQQYQQKASTSYSQNSLLKDAYKVFGLTENATEEEIKREYRKLAKLHHPDLQSNDTEEQKKLAHERFLVIQQAYELILKNN